ncbi:protein PTST, chloroplastic [Macadamia integrifolia]|uniref:protein PTST, chloroplastic n=1 Tax=Macadamia integrifolia TaxID=60698 RepID=UPI001C50039F|nr:protein PTST, chloroplastic [Macadamia integrifolia]
MTRGQILADTGNDPPASRWSPFLWRIRKRSRTHRHTESTSLAVFLSHKHTVALSVLLLQAFNQVRSRLFWTIRFPLPKGVFIMECQMTSFLRGCPEKHNLWFSWCSRKLEQENNQRISCNVALCNLRIGSQHLKFLRHAFVRRFPMQQSSWRTFSMPVSLEKESSLSTEDPNDSDEVPDKGSSEELLSKPLDSDKLKSLLADSERKKLTRKLSEANQHNRFLKRQLQVKEDALVNFKSELADMELEVQALVKLAEEVAKTGNLEASRKINGKYIQSHLLSRLEAVHEKMKEQMKDVEAAQSKEVQLFWCGMAESVQVMGSFDGWSQGEHLSPEYSGSFTKFFTTLKLRPGRYEIKFLVDGEWQLSPEFPTIGVGMLNNNLLVVE